MSSLVVKAAEKAKGRLRDRADRRSRHPPRRPPPPRVNLKSLESESTFENILDRPDEVSDPLFAYTGGPEHNLEHSSEWRTDSSSPMHASYAEEDVSSLPTSDGEHEANENNPLVRDARGRLSPDRLHLGDPLTGQLVSESSSGASRSSSPPQNVSGNQGRPEDETVARACTHSSVSTITGATSEGDYSDCESSDTGPVNAEDYGGGFGSGNLLHPPADLTGGGESDDELFKSALSVLQTHYSCFDIDHSSEEECSSSVVSNESCHQPSLLSVTHTLPDLPEDYEALHPGSLSADPLQDVRQLSRSSFMSAPEVDEHTAGRETHQTGEHGDVDMDPDVVASSHSSDSLSPPKPSHHPEYDMNSIHVDESETEMWPGSSPVMMSHSSHLAAGTRSSPDSVQLTEASEHPLIRRSSDEQYWPPETAGLKAVGSAPAESSERFVMFDDHFGPSVTTVARGSGDTTVKATSLHRHCPKANSAGQVAPPRPAVSPRLRERMRQRSIEAELPQKPKALVYGSSERVSAKKLDQTPSKLTQTRGTAAALTEAGTDIPPATSPQSSFQYPHSSVTDSQSSLANSAFQPSGRLHGVHHTEECQTAGVMKGDFHVNEQDFKSGSVAADPDDLFPPLSPSYHMLLAGILYLYFSLNIFPYLAGLVSGFFLFFLTVGALFIYYAHNGTKEHGTTERSASSQVLSGDFVRRMNVNFHQIKHYKVRELIVLWLSCHLHVGIQP